MLSEEEKGILREMPLYKIAKEFWASPWGKECYRKSREHNVLKEENAQ